LQFPIVYCPFTWDRKADKTRSSEIIFHENGHLYSYTGEKAPGEYSRQASEEELAELMRLFYVALTRAQNKCLIYWGRINSTELTAPAYASCRGMEPGNIVAELKKQMKSFTDIELLEELRFFEDASGGTLKVNVIEEGGAEPGKILETEEAGKLSCRTMPGGRKISGQWGIMSFSSMASGKYSNDFHSAGFKEKFDDDKDISAGNSGVPAEGFFAFPAGPGPGTCLHAIMEKLDFTAVNSPEVEKLVTETIVMSGLKYSYGGNVEEYSDSTLEMLKRLVAAPFQPENGTGDFVLSDIPSRARLNEFEFYYPVKGMAVTELKNLFGRYSNDLKNGLPPESIERLKLDFSDGVMHGWIDMIFEYGGKYYIIDWKSNFLGTSFSDYTADKLRESLREHLYTLQYYIYSLALHKYLRERLENYSYDTCFGGVFYVFIRGVTPDVPGNGIFFDKPPEAFIREFESIQGVAHD
jgi:exodeoxyribonuclease V beta subunit